VGDAAAGLGHGGDFGVVEMYGMNPDEAWADQAELLQTLQRAFAMLGNGIGDFLTGFVEVAVDGQVQLLGERGDALEGTVGDRVRRMRGQAETDQRMVAKGFAGGQTLGDVIVGIAGVVAGKFQRGDAERCAHAEFRRRLGGGVGKEIHVIETGDAAAQHFGAGQARAVEHELARYVGGFGRPDVLLQPFLQGQVVGNAAHQAHRGVRVQVDQAGDQDVLVELPVFARLVAAAGFGCWQDGEDVAVVDGNRMPAQDFVGVYGGNPAGFNQQIDGFGCRCHGIGHLYAVGGVVN